jgi:hypothetical protein
MVIRRDAARLTQASTLKDAWRAKFIAVGAIVEILRWPLLAGGHARLPIAYGGVALILALPPEIASPRLDPEEALTNAVREQSPLLHLLQEMRCARQVGLAGVWLDVELFHHPVLDKHRIAL